MFEGYVRATHEAESEAQIKHLLAREESGSSAALKDFIIKRDARLKLKIDASHINIYLLAELEELFPHSRYLLTYKHPLEWLRSMTDDSLRRDTAQHWHDFRDFRFGEKASLPEEQALAEANLYSLTGYFAYWRNSIDLVRETIPKERLLMVQTRDLHSRSLEIAEFCQIPGFKPDEKRSHAFVNNQRFGLIEKLGADYVAQACQNVCEPTLSDLFPDVDIQSKTNELVQQDT